jgi:hypothetical protein
MCGNDHFRFQALVKFAPVVFCGIICRKSVYPPKVGSFL